jgi:3-hydroxyisobutyrate dehydrogenase-like beta-hydroxyacid dehydrogenase
VTGTPASAGPAGPAKPLAAGFVGLGQMGQPMALRLAGWPGGLIVYDTRGEAMEPLVQAGAAAADSLAAVAARADLICVMVRDDDQVRSVVRELAAATEGPGGTIIAVHSTIGPATAASLAAEFSGTAAEVVDAPVSGGFMGAADGRLAVMFGGSREACERCREPFACFADLVMYMGPAGAGTHAKLARNLLHFAAFTAAAEAQRLAEAAGLDLRKLARVVRHSDAVTGGPGSIMLRSTTAPLDSSDPLREILDHVRALGEKDLSLALELGRQLGTELPMAQFALANFAAGLGLPPPELPA